MRVGIWIGMIGWMALGCGVPSDPEPSRDWKEAQNQGVNGFLKADGTADPLEFPVRLAQVDLTGTWPEGSVENLLSSSLSEASGGSGEKEWKGRLREGVVASLRTFQGTSGTAVVRSQRYRVEHGIKRQVFPGGFRLPFGLDADGEVELARIFHSEEDAEQSSPLTLLDIPFDATSAKALPEGSVVSLPIRTRLATDVNGSFLSKGIHHSSNLLPRLMTSASGTFSGVRQGMLVGEGTFTLQFIRLPGDSIRVRVFSGARRKGSAGGTLSGAMAASYVFLPSSILGRAKEIRKRVERWADRIGPKKTLSERIEAYSSRARVPLGLLLDHAGLGESDGWSWLEESWEGAEDAAVGWATSGMMSLDTLEWTVRSSVEHMLDQLTMGWKDKIEPQLDTIQRWSNRSVNLSGAVSLSTSFERDVRTVCDYTFDLNDEHARVALERAISGRTVLLGAFQGLAGSNVTDALFADFTLADSLAQEDIGAGAPRVERGARGFSDLRKQQESVRLSGFWLSNGWEIQSDQNRFLLEKPEGETEEWTGYGWDWKHQTNWWGDSKVESLGSGAFVEDSGGQSPAGYWVTWDKTFPTSAAFPVHEALSESLNLTGPVGLLAGLPTLYHGEYAGRVSVQLELFFSKEVLEALMDPHRTPDSLIWAEWARVAQGFDNTFGLPYLPFGVIPPYLGEIPGAVESCATVQAAWGAHYCAFIADTFLPALRMAQDSGSPTDSLDFLHSIYTRKVGPGNPIGARILSRFIANLAYSLGEEEHVGIRMVIRNSEDESEVASPQLLRGETLPWNAVGLMQPEGFR